MHTVLKLPVTLKIFKQYLSTLKNSNLLAGSPALKPLKKNVKI